MYPARTVKLEVGSRNIMSFDVPTLSVEAGEARLSYGLSYTTAQLDGSIARFSELLPELLKLAEIEKTCNMLADEIEKTRRRVNALEYVMIPDLEETIRFIAMKLDENERGALTRLMKVKEMIFERDQVV